MNGRQVAGAAVVTVILIVSKILGFGREGALDGVAGAALFAGLAGALGGGALGDFAATGARLVGLIAFGGVVYAALCRALRVRDLEFFAGLVRRKRA